MQNFHDYIKDDFKVEAATDQVWSGDLVEPAIGVITSHRDGLSFDQNVERFDALNRDFAALRGLYWDCGLFWLGGHFDDGTRNLSLLCRTGANDAGNLKGQLRKLIEVHNLVGAIYKPAHTKCTYLTLPNKIDRDIGQFGPDLISGTMPLLCGSKESFTFDAGAYRMTFFQAMSKSRFGTQPAMRDVLAADQRHW